MPSGWTVTPEESIVSSQILDEAYERLHLTGPEFGGDEEGNNGLSNHGPMAVEVLVRRGHELEVPRWVDAYLPRLEDLPGASDRITDESWRDALGNGRRVGDWTAFFTRQVAERPWREVLATWWPRLLPGIAAGATHGVIRVGHVVRTLLTGTESPAAVTELAHGLAFWAGRWRTVPGVAVPAGRLDAAAALEAVPHLPVQRGVVASRIPRLADLASWSAAVASLRPPADDVGVEARLTDLIDAATVRYLTHAHGSPVLLVHTATAPNAVLHTLPALPRELWAPSLSAVCGRRACRRSGPPAPRSWRCTNRRTRRRARRCRPRRRRPIPPPRRWNARPRTATSTSSSSATRPPRSTRAPATPTPSPPPSTHPSSSSRAAEAPRQRPSEAMRRDPADGHAGGWRTR